MTGAHVLSLVGLVLASVGAVVDAPPLLAVGLAVAVWFFLVGESEDEAIRGLMTFLSIPAILTVAILTTS